MSGLSYTPAGSTHLALAEEVALSGFMCECLPKPASISEFAAAGLIGPKIYNYLENEWF
jgi:hypothetical protein